MNQSKHLNKVIKQNAVISPLLPVTYQQVSYITMSSGSCINLNISLTQGVIGEMKINITSGNFTNSAGTKDDTTSRYNRNYFSFFYDTWSSKYVIGIGAGGYSGIQPVYTHNTDYTVAYNTVNKTATINGTYYNFASNWQDNQNPPYSRYNWTVHGQPNGMESSRGDDGTAILYYYKLSDNNNVLKRDLYPCYRKSDNVAGMYDMVTNTFFTNAGSSGTFTVGANV